MHGRGSTWDGGYRRSGNGFNPVARGGQGEERQGQVSGLPSNRYVRWISSVPCVRRFWWVK